MTYEEAQAFLNSLVNYERRPPVDGAMRREVTLDRVRELAARLGDPQKDLASIHVAGTKGKGSTSAFAEAVLRAHGLSTGLYTSPHLVDVRERIMLNGGLIDRELFASEMQKLVSLIEPRRKDPDRRATYFETLTHLAFLSFRDAALQAVVVEVGMGGRLDATNIITPLVSVITPIGKDHMRQLGDTIPRIAREKAGIIKQGVPVVANAGPAEAVEVVESVARERSAEVYLLGRDFVMEDEGGGSFRLNFPRAGLAAGGFRPSLAGEHQRANAATALAAATLFLENAGVSADADAARRGLAGTAWPGRIQRVAEDPPTYVDGAHNVQSLGVLVETLSVLHPGKPLVIGFGCGIDKDVGGMLEFLKGAAAEVVFTRSRSPRALTPDELEDAYGIAGAPPASKAACPAEAYSETRRIAVSIGGVAVMTGSFYVAGEVLEHLQGG
ncbi:MAG: bifunctional folylpolyglutamate synthase/dihydrofolate synthase [Planctomycetes bacterium]|nr:bifunctional folylpolyglutamate synthase/dihydrofolate synthase [Planctomycetota bacterium]